MASKPAYAKGPQIGESGNEKNIPNDGPKRPDGNDRAITREGVVKHQIPPRPRTRDELVRGERIRPFRFEGNLTSDGVPGYRDDEGRPGMTGSPAEGRVSDAGWR